MSVLKRLFARSAQTPQKQAAGLLAVVVEVSRREAFFGAGRTPDTFDGRLEIVMLNAVLALVRLQGDAPASNALAQEFTDQFFAYLDASLRESGVGDLSVPKKIKAIAKRFYGRFGVYRAGLEASDPTELEAAVARNVFGTREAAYAGALASYMRRQSSSLAAADLAGLASQEAWAAQP